MITLDKLDDIHKCVLRFKKLTDFLEQEGAKVGKEDGVFELSIITGMGYFGDTLYTVKGGGETLCEAIDSLP